MSRRAAREANWTRRTGVLADGAPGARSLDGEGPFAAGVSAQRGPTATSAPTTSETPATAKIGLFFSIALPAATVSLASLAYGTEPQAASALPPGANARTARVALRIGGADAPPIGTEETNGARSTARAAIRGIGVERFASAGGLAASLPWSARRAVATRAHVGPAARTAPRMARFTGAADSAPARALPGSQGAGTVGGRGPVAGGIAGACALVREAQRTSEAAPQQRTIVAAASAVVIVLIDGHFTAVVGAREWARTIGEAQPAAGPANSPRALSRLGPRRRASATARTAVVGIGCERRLAPGLGSRVAVFEPRCARADGARAADPAGGRRVGEHARGA